MEFQLPEDFFYFCGKCKSPFGFTRPKIMPNQIRVCPFCRYHHIGLYDGKGFLIAMQDPYDGWVANENNWRERDMIQFADDFEKPANKLDAIRSLLPYLAKRQRLLLEDEKRKENILIGAIFGVGLTVIEAELARYKRSIEHDEPDTTTATDDFNGREQRIELVKLLDQSVRLSIVAVNSLITKIANNENTLANAQAVSCVSSIISEFDSDLIFNLAKLDEMVGNSIPQQEQATSTLSPPDDLEEEERVRVYIRNASDTDAMKLTIDLLNMQNDERRLVLSNVLSSTFLDGWRAGKGLINVKSKDQFRQR